MLAGGVLQVLLQSEKPFRRTVGRDGYMIFAISRVYDAAGNVIETHEHAGDLKEP